MSRWASSNTSVCRRTATDCRRRRVRRWPGTRSPQRRVGRAATTQAQRVAPLGHRHQPTVPLGAHRWPLGEENLLVDRAGHRDGFAPLIATRLPVRACPDMWNSHQRRAAHVGHQEPRVLHANRLGPPQRPPPPPPVRWALRLVGMGNGTLDGCTVSIAPIEGFLCPLHTRRCDPRCPWQKTAVAGRSDGGPGTVAPQARSASAGAGVAHRDTDRSAGLGTVPVRRLSDDGPGTPPPRHRPLTEGRSSRPDVAPGSPSSREDHPFDHDGFPSGWSTPAAPRHTKCPPTVGHRADRRVRGRMSRLRFS